ncbi:MAG: ubiquitin-like domain-containing protein, partial [Jiangellales bacterium]
MPTSAPSSRRWWRRGGIVAGLAVVGGLAAVGVSAASSAVTVTVDGDDSQVLSFGETVADVLDAEGIEVTSDDLVVPSLDSPLQDGTQIEVAYARDVTVTLDGVTDDVTTTALSVEELLGELGLREGAVTTTVSRSAGIGRDGFEVAIRTPKKVVIVDGDTRLPLVVTSTTVGEALDSAGIELGRRDEVVPAASSALSDGTTITLARFTTTKRTETSTVDYRTITRESSDLFTDEERVEQEGRVGERTRVYRVALLGGQKQGEKLLSNTVTTPPVDRVVLVGTTPRPAPEPAPQPVS